MSGPSDYRAEAVRVLRIAENKAVTTGDYAAVAQGYVRLAGTPLALEDERTAEAEARVRDLESDRRILHGAVQDLLAQAATGSDEYWAAVDRLRALVGDEPQPTRDPLRKPSAKFHKQGTVIPPERKP